MDHGCGHGNAFAPLVAAEDVPGEQAESRARGLFLVAGDRDLGDHERGIVAQLEVALTKDLLERGFFNGHRRACKNRHGHQGE